MVRDGASAPPHHKDQLNVPLRSLKRSSRPGARTSGVCPDGNVVAAFDATDTEVAGATEVSEEPLPHNSRTAGEIGSARSPAWNSERKIGCCAEAVLRSADDVRVTGATARESGK